VEFLLKDKGKIALGILVLVSCVLATGVLGTALSATQTSRVISNVGSVKGVGVGIYWDSACTNRTSSINWGMLDPGVSISKTIYIRNEGNSPATLSMTTSNWSPAAASSYIALTWNYVGQTLGVNQVIQVRVTLVVSSSISGVTNFSFDITVTATA
jgi:hypothetical protein